MFIKEVIPSIIKDSRGEKTIQINLKTLLGSFISSAPSGKSKGKHEVPAYNEKGINWSLRMLKIFSNRLKGKNIPTKNFSSLKDFEAFIKRFEQKFGRFGANCVYALESAFLKAAAKENGKELWQFVAGDKKKVKIPRPVGNCIGGGYHSDGKKKPDFQEFLVIPRERKFSKAVTRMIHVYNKAGKLIKRDERRFLSKKNDESAWRTKLTNEETLEILFELGREFKVNIGIDAASSSFYKGGYYHYENKKLIRDRKEQVDYIERVIEKYGLFYVEDGLQEEDFLGFVELSNAAKKMARKLKFGSLIVGDDLTVTNLTRLRRAVQSKGINAVIIKPNQNGSLVSVASIVDFCKKNNLKMIFSHRSGETMDDGLADFAVGFGADFIKCGVNGKERLIKLRRVMEIERSLKR